jgi:poly(beta-D-mannuronate) lyase
MLLSSRSLHIAVRLLPALLICSSPAGAQDKAPLQAPFHLRTQAGPLQTEQRGAKSCAPAPAAVTRLSITSKYGDDGPQRDTINPDADAAARNEMQDIRAFSRQVVKAANEYTRSGNPAAARCTLSLLADWRRAGALMQIDNANAEFERVSTLAGLSLALLQVSPAVGREPDYAPTVAWMRELAQAATRYFDGSSKLKGSRNNHRDWAALAAASVATLSGDRALLDWSARAYQAEVCSAGAEGGLPLELERGQKARDYHLFALSALAPLAAILQSNGIDAGAECKGALHRIVGFTLKALDDPSQMAALAGKPQEALKGKKDGDGMPGPNQLAFLEAYVKQYPEQGPAVGRWLRLRPFASTNLGGNQTLLYGGGR